MSYRDPLDAARARISALEDLLDTRRFDFDPKDDGGDRRTLREIRTTLAEERAEHTEALASSREELTRAVASKESFEEELRSERARRQAEVSLLRTKLEEAERSVQTNASLFEAEQTMQGAAAAVEKAHLEQQIVHKDTSIRELREEVRLHVRGERREIRAFYTARVRAVGTELAEQGTRARRLEEALDGARGALASLPPADARDREGMVERELAKRKVAVADAELIRIRDRVQRLEYELERITSAEADLAGRS